MRTSPTLAFVLLALAGCGGGKDGGDTGLEANAHVLEDVVVISVGMERTRGVDATFRVHGVEQTVDSTWAHFAFPLADLDAGATTWPASVTRHGETTSADVSFEVPASPSAKPFFYVADCAFEGSSARLSGDWVSSDRGLLYCAVDEDGALQLTYVATRGATVTLGGATLPAKAYPGKGLPMTASVRLDDVLAYLPPEQLDRAEVREVPVVVETAAGRAEGTVSLDYMSAAEAVANAIRGVGDGKAPSWAQPLPPGGTPRALVVHGDNDHIRSVGGDGPLRDAAVIALSRPLEPKELGECGPYVDLVNDDDTGTRPHQRIDTEVVIYTARDAEEIARTTLEADTHPCPETIRSIVEHVTDSVDAEAVDAYVQAQLDALTARE